MDEGIQARVGLRKVSRVAGPVGLVLGVLAFVKKLADLLGVAGAPGDAMIVWDLINEPLFLQALLLATGASLTYVGFQDQIQQFLQAVVFRRRLAGFKNEPAERRAERVRGEIDALIRRGKWMQTSEGGYVSRRLFDQWVSHTERLFERGIHTDPPECVTGEDWIGMKTKEFQSEVHQIREFERIRRKSSTEVVPREGLIGAHYLAGPIEALRSVRARLGPEDILLD